MKTHGALPFRFLSLIPFLALTAAPPPALAQAPAPAVLAPGLNLSFDMPGILEPMMSTVTGRDLRIPHTLQIRPDGSQANLVSVSRHPLGDPDDPQRSATGHPITHVRDPQTDLHAAAGRLATAARQGDASGMRAAAAEALDILLGRTTGRIYDGFPLLNFNRWTSDEVEARHFAPDVVPGEYKLKMIRPARDEAGRWLTEPCWYDPAETCHIWEVDIRHLWYGMQFDSDTFLVGMPYEVEIDGEMVRVDWDDTLRINWHIYSLVEEDFGSTAFLLDALLDERYPRADKDLSGPYRGATVRLPYKGVETVFQRFRPNTVNHMTVQLPSLRFLRGLYTWGWHVHPPRIHFTQPVFQIRNVHTGEIEWEWSSRSYVDRNREELTLDSIGEAAPEKKIYRVARAVLEGNATPQEIAARLEGGETTWRDWIALMQDQRQLPPEARAMLEADGKQALDYDFVNVYLNNELYGYGPQEATMRPWTQGDVLRLRLLNLDNHTHYFRNVSFGPALQKDLANTTDSGIFSNEILSFKPLYGAPKVAEMQWRTGWGFRPGFSVIQQSGVFPRPEDRTRLKPFIAPRLGFPLDQQGRKLGHDELAVFWGYQFQDAERNPFPFDPPRFMVETLAHPAFEGLWDLAQMRQFSVGERPPGYPRLMLARAVQDLESFKNRSAEPGVVIGQFTEGWGIAQMCPEDPPGFCRADLKRFHPLGITNTPRPQDPTYPKTELSFPGFLRNPAQGRFGAGDIIPPNLTFEPFLYLSPRNGTLFLDPEDPSAGYWTDLTYAHGRTLYAQSAVDISIEMPLASGRLFYQFDDLFHDNAIFSLHPTVDANVVQPAIAGEAAPEPYAVEGESRR